MYTATKNNKRLKELYRLSLHIKSAIPHPKIMGIIRECGGKMHMSEGEFAVGLPSGAWWLIVGFVVFQASGRRRTRTSLRRSRTTTRPAARAASSASSTLSPSFCVWIGLALTHLRSPQVSRPGQHAEDVRHRPVHGTGDQAVRVLALAVHALAVRAVDELFGVLAGTRTTPRSPR
jgi:hypothetical protein